MRLQLAINVEDLEASIEFYRKALGVEVHKREPGYANFAIEQPPLGIRLVSCLHNNNRAGGPCQLPSGSRLLCRFCFAL